MAKVLVETTGAFSLVDMSGGQDINAHRPTLVTKTNFVSSRLTTKQLRDILEKDAPEDMTDEKVAEAFEKGGREAVIKLFGRGAKSE